ncbi:hypothetical protein FKM82_011404, partial [Ascaphus truei]
MSLLNTGVANSSQLNQVPPSNSVPYIVYSNCSLSAKHFLQQSFFTACFVMYRNQITYATSVQHCNIGIIFLECGTRPLYDTSQASGTVGGGDVNVGEFPWQVSIQNRNSHFCGGSILNNWWILTAAHCFLNLNDFTDVTIVVGITDLKQKEKKRKIQQVIAHAGFDKHMNNDVALIQVKAAIRFNKQSAPVCLPTQNDLDKWRDCWATGWGFTGGADAVEPNILQKVAMQLLSSEKCAEMNKVSSNILCAGYEEGGNRLCQADNGGPLVCTYANTKTWYLVGVVSWGIGCGQNRQPGVYTIVSNYVHWINK